MNLLRYSIMVVLLAVAFAAFVFYLGGIDILYRATYQPAIVQIERNVTENSKSFIDSTNSAAAAQITEYYRVSTDLAAVVSAGNDGMADAYRQQLEAIEGFVCNTIAPLNAEDYSSAVQSFVATGACVGGR